MPAGLPKHKTNAIHTTMAHGQRVDPQIRRRGKRKTGKEKGKGWVGGRTETAAGRAAAGEVAG
jgi:hypothetical protein